MTDTSSLAIYQPSLWIPHYTDGPKGEWSIETIEIAPMKGYWGDAYLVKDMPVLKDNQDNIWMSISPSEIQSQEIGCHFSYGHTVIMGCGMGIAALNTALNPNVDKVTIVEKDPDILSLVESCRLLEQLPENIQAKITLLEIDAADFIPDGSAPVDCLQMDIWLPLHEKLRYQEVRRHMMAIEAKSVFFWGQETVLAQLICERFDGPKLLNDIELQTFIDQYLGYDLLWPKGVQYGHWLMKAAQCMFTEPHQNQLGLLDFVVPAPIDWPTKKSAPIAFRDALIRSPIQAKS